MPETAAVLEVAGLEAWYGDSHILHGVDFAAGHGEIVSLLGRNGAGKTTTLRAIMGLVGRRTGSIKLAGEEIVALPADRIARRGIGYVPEERGIFASLSVEENLRLPPVVQSGGLPLADIYALFPNLKERLRGRSGARLSGGEQQMLAIGRILRTGARLLLLDEPTEGLAPVITQQIAASLRRLRELGFTIVLVEQNFHFAAKLANRHCVIEHGRVVESLEGESIAEHMEELNDLLGV